MISFKDFVPEQTTARGILSEAQYESFDSTVQRANEWIAQSQIRLINVETVLLPNIHDFREEGSTDPEFRVHEFIDWHQLIRVWYEDLSQQ